MTNNNNNGIMFYLQSIGSHHSQHRPHKGLLIKSGNLQMWSALSIPTGELIRI